MSRKCPPQSAPISREYPATSATRKGSQPKLDSVLVQGAPLSGGWFGARKRVPAEDAEQPLSPA